MLATIPTRRGPFLTFGFECLLPTQQLWSQVARVEWYDVRISMCAMAASRRLLYSIRGSGGPFVLPGGQSRFPITQKCAI